MPKHFLNLWASILAFEVSLIFCLFLGIFLNTPTSYSQYDKTHWYVINRGYPVAWAGVSLKNRRVDFPIIQAPFLTRKDEWSSITWNKIINLSVFVPVLLFGFVFFYPFTFVFGKAGKEHNRFRKRLIIPVAVFYYLLILYFYFFWFFRI